MSRVVATDRKLSADLIRRWLSSSITNEELDDGWPMSSQDEAVVQIGRELWTHYSDMPQATLKAVDLAPAECELLKRCIAFLESSEVYKPVTSSVVLRPKTFFGKLLRYRNPPWEAMRLDIDDERRKWWPFADEAQFRKVSQDGGRRTSTSSAPEG